jgi:hypothetical protein
VLDALRGEVAGWAESGQGPREIAADRVARELADEPRLRPLLDAAVADEHRADPFGPPPPEGPRARRAARAERVHATLDALVLAGQLVLDGPGRLALPGFGPSTWRAVAALRAGAAGPEARWAAAVAREPAGDLGDAAPAALRALDAPPALAGLARRVHAWEARRQDARDALLRAAAAEASAAGRGLSDSVESLRRDAAELEAVIAAADAAVARLWDEGLRRAGDG